MKSYETFSTTADSGVRCSGDDYGQLYTNALRGLNLLLFGANRRPGRSAERVPFRFRGDGPESVLVNLLSEALYWVNQRGKRVAAARVLSAGRNGVEAELLLAPLRRRPRCEVKAVTYHRLRVEERAGGFRAAVVLDT